VKRKAVKMRESESESKRVEFFREIEIERRKVARE
jgi:hypothetical protein